MIEGNDTPSPDLCNGHPAANLVYTIRAHARSFPDEQNQAPMINKSQTLVQCSSSIELFFIYRLRNSQLAELNSTDVMWQISLYTSSTLEQKCQRYTASKVVQTQVLDICILRSESPLLSSPRRTTSTPIICRILNDWGWKSSPERPQTTQTRTRRTTISPCPPKPHSALPAAVSSQRDTLYQRRAPLEQGLCDSHCTHHPMCRESPWGSSCHTHIAYPCGRGNRASPERLTTSVRNRTGGSRVGS
ncbi:uncharacterized protein BCR38DRAFT_415115 [Pseudomassariella vexata]|uniref:Uncharacterized protein n=1 Tax=Pseudomassariella vexata TaxID=1141098 RepID=A0A1Y2D6R2_9PEZI|nr:uncharacterized protein BCR38DRAFT_415115 [Pseudomassariella vexata]ORY54962.1 hypothetical protein BCR38DRAFT_415115 [Pseudomassariella vexata]